MRDTAAWVSENLAEILHPNEGISRRALRLLELHALSAGLRVVDALIAATALDARVAVATANSSALPRHRGAVAGDLPARAVGVSAGASRLASMVGEGPSVDVTPPSARRGRRPNLLEPDRLFHYDGSIRGRVMADEILEGFRGQQRG